MSLDLTFERTTSIPPEKLWQGWADPKLLMQWFCPRPWRVIDARLDLRAGGEFYTVMQSPEGQKFPNNGCFLEVIPNKKLVWTNMMTAGFSPVDTDSKLDFSFTATLTLGKKGDTTLYKAVVTHANEEGRKKHEAMNFEEGWGQAFNQLTELLGTRQ